MARLSAPTFLAIVTTTALIGIVQLSLSESAAIPQQEPLCKRLESTFARRGLNAACDSDGYFLTNITCVNDKCYCVDVSINKRLKNYSFSLFANGNTTCQCAVDQREYRRTRLIGLLLMCEPNGDYSPVQCTGSVCYCVDKRGKPIGTQTANIGLHNSLNCTAV